MEEAFLPVSSYVVCLSPLAKIFQPRMHDHLMRNPEAVFDDKTAFQLIVDKPSGAFMIDYKKPKLIKDPNLLMWLTGGRDGTMSRETDHTGIIYAPIQDDMLEALTNLTGLYAEDEEKGKKEQERVTKEISKKYGDKLKEARALSDFRVMRQIKTVHENLQKQYQTNKENNMGLYNPSTVEFLCTYVLSAEIEKNKSDRSKITTEFAKLMEQTRAI